MGFLKSLFPFSKKKQEIVQPEPEIITKIKTGRIDGRKLFSGGKKEDWATILKLAKDWQKILKDNGYIQDLKIERVTNGFTKDISCSLIHGSASLKESKEVYGTYDKLLSGSTWSTTNSSPHETIYPEGFNAEEAWMWSKYRTDLAKMYTSPSIIDNDIATAEVEVLKLGGCILGAFAQKILIYFPFLSESVMAKILSEKIKDPEPSIFRGSTYFGSGSQWGGGGSSGASGFAGSFGQQITMSGLSPSTLPIVSSKQIRQFKNLINGVTS